MRIGAKKRPFYRVVAVDERKKRTGGYLELLGTYNPLTEPKEILLKQERINDWLKKGAQSSDGFLRIIGKAPQRPPRKPKKEKKKAVAGEEKPAQPEPVETEAGEEKIEEIKPKEGEAKSEASQQGEGDATSTDQSLGAEQKESTDNENQGEADDSVDNTQSTTEVTPESSR